MTTTKAASKKSAKGKRAKPLKLQAPVQVPDTVAARTSITTTDRKNGENATKRRFANILKDLGFVLTQKTKEIRSNEYETPAVEGAAKKLEAAEEKRTAIDELVEEDQDDNTRKIVKLQRKVADAKADIAKLNEDNINIRSKYGMRIKKADEEVGKAETILTSLKAQAHNNAEDAVKELEGDTRAAERQLRELESDTIETFQFCDAHADIRGMVEDIPNINTLLSGDLKHLKLDSPESPLMLTMQSNGQSE